MSDNCKNLSKVFFPPGQEQEIKKINWNKKQLIWRFNYSALLACKNGYLSVLHLWTYKYTSKQ